MDKCVAQFSEILAFYRKKYQINLVFFSLSTYLPKFDICTNKGTFNSVSSPLAVKQKAACLGIGKL